ncbi:transcription antitermination factor NusB [Saliterribacillus persicus]|uniref:Transcription antitermination protein NusB n=1 Tax=Saliterribacillus persicus TaxID=930114 RepID=A0A368XBT2_9BACI|nr:transcription antitermination factor NusB [Saliterribacillus persicus]RCW65410.1 NusB antitermination factor [Saliterribacillus persicus]
MKRHDAREKAFQLLFQLDIHEVDIEEGLNQLLEDIKPDEFLLTLVNGVIDNKEAIDERISTHLENWSLNRIASVERTLLRISTYELFYYKDAPESVIINEAIELSHVFGDEKSGKFINGVLSKMIK